MSVQLTKRFVSDLRADVVEGAIDLYVRELQADPNSLKEQDRRTLALAFGQMTPAQRKALSALVRRIVSETVATVLGVIDGSTVLDSFRDDDFALSYQGVPIENTQDHYLSAEQEQAARGGGGS